MLTVLTSFLSIAASCNALPPDQPTSGPGGSTYVHASVAESSYGSGVTKYWLYEPAQPTPTSAPLVIFNHAWLANDPGNYRNWINHIVRRGAIVLYPNFQEALTDPAKHLPNALISIKDGIARLQAGGHVRPDLTKVAIVGHSAGGLLTVNLAAVAATEGIPQAEAVFVAAPSGPNSLPVGGGPHLLKDLSQVPDTTLFLAVAGDEDTIVGQDPARQFYYGMSQVPAVNKDFVLVHSDRYGKTDLVADHFAPMAGSSNTDALDYYGYWKLLDGLTDAAFYGTNRQYALGNTPEQRFMEEWSDGTPVTELTATDNP
jgi:surfactin synthase thioesterase subunit